MLDHPKAKNEMRTLFLTRFRSYLANGLPNNDPIIPPLQLTPAGSTDTYEPLIIWQNTEKTEPNDNSRHWLRFSSQNVLKRQKSLTGGRSESVGTRHTTQGLITVELYFSKSAYQTDDMDNINAIVERCFIQANTPCGVWFRNAIIVELNPEENYFRSNVLAEYEYDSVIN